MGVGAAAVAGTGLLAGEEAEGQAACNLPAGCFGTHDINVCYSPWRVVASQVLAGLAIALTFGPPALT